MSLIIVEAIRGRCASFMILTATVLEIFGGLVLVIYFSSVDMRKLTLTLQMPVSRYNFHCSHINF